MADQASFSISGDDDLFVNIRNLTDLSNRETSAAMRKVATEVQKLARKYAPEDRGNLEDAIIVDGGEQGRDAAGRFAASTSYTIGVDEDMPIPERPGKRVGDYALEMHEGDYELGPKSLAKEARLGVQVGPKYLERALDELEAPARKYLEDAINDCLKRYGA